MKTDDSQLGTLKFIAIAVVLMVLADHYLFGGTRSYIENAKQEALSERMIAAEVKDLDPAPPVVVRPENGEFFEMVPAPEKEPEVVEKKVVPPPAVAEKEEPVVPVVPYTGKARVAIIIDDLGMDVKRSRKIVDMDEPLTLAFLPYAPKTKELAVEAKKKGHSLIIHAPMEASDHSMNIGPIGLRGNMDRDTFDKNFGEMLGSFDGYEGINNHMGSGLTQDAVAMTHLMELLKNHNLFFVDSRTINTSVAAKKAKEAGIPYATRDVFLDHVDSLEFVRNALKQTEKLALRKGSAIAIGHPRDATIQGLREWLPTLEAKGIEIVPVKNLLMRSAASVVAEPVTEVISPAVIPSEVEGSQKVEPIAEPDPSAPAAEAASGRDDDIGVVEGNPPMVSVTLPDGTEQLIHLPQQ